MTTITRRSFIKRSASAASAFAISARSRGADLNSEVRLAIVGLGGIDVVGGVGGRGRQLISRFRRVPGARIVAICDVDKTVLEHGAKQFTDKGEKVATHVDFRRILDDKNVDAVVLATPNHWHGLGTIWACQAGKDVYVEKPFSYNIWEGRQMVAAAAKYGRIVQTGMQRRSSFILPEAFEYLRGGELGRVQFGHALVYRARAGIGKVASPTPIPAGVDYDLWCGPAPMGPLMRNQLHYEWHWFWDTGNGEMGNNGVHMTDICRWALGQEGPPPRAMSMGGRFAFEDAGETPNVQIAVFDYNPAPIICEIRNVARDAAKKSPGAMGKFRNADHGIVIVCEGGYLAADYTGAAAFDNQGKQIKEFKDGRKSGEIEAAHAINFLNAVRTRKAESLVAGPEVGHVSAACCHMANISHRLGKESSPAEIAEKVRTVGDMAETFDRCREYLRENGVDIDRTPAVMGPWVAYDGKLERFTGEFADRANQLSQREGRAPFVIPRIV